MKNTAEEILKPHVLLVIGEEVSIKKRKVTYLGALKAMEDYKDQHTAPLIEALERINNMSEDTGRSGCTYSDTDFDSESVVYGYNMGLNHIKNQIQTELPNAQV